MFTLKNLCKYLKTVRTHRKYVRKMCFKMGIPWQGLVHDLSKYSWQEISICKYYEGTRSPHEKAREVLGYSPNWMNHYHKNKHHWNFWLDIESFPNQVRAVKMPYKYVIESVCDMVGASKAYNVNSDQNWEPKMVWDYWERRCKGQRLMHKHSEYLLEKLLWNFYQMGEKEFLKWYKQNKDYIKEKYNNETLEASDIAQKVSEEGEE